MSSEERWAQNREWAEEKRRGFDLEIKQHRRNMILPDECCSVPKCKNIPTNLITVGQTAGHGGMEIPLCIDHDDEDLAFEIYRDRRD